MAESTAESISRRRPQSSSQTQSPGPSNVTQNDSTKVEKPPVKNNPDGFELFVTYSQIWALHYLLEEYMRIGGSYTILLGEPDKAVYTVLLLASLSGSVPVVLCAHLWSMLDFYINMRPFSDRGHWAAHHDFAVTLAMLSVVFFRFQKDSKTAIFRASLSPSECKLLMDGAAAFVVPQMVLWYFGVGFWKINTSFFEPTGNCATFLFMMLWAGYVPASLSPDWLVKLAAWSAPWITVIVECGIGILVAFPGWPRRCGLALALLLQFLISITPPPCNIAIYGFSLAARYIFFLPEATAKAVAEIKTIMVRTVVKFERPPLKTSAAVIAALISPQLFSNWTDELNYPWMQDNATPTLAEWTISGYVALMLLYSRALYLDATSVAASSEKGTRCQWRWGKLWWFVVLEGLLFEYAAPILGIQESGNAHPFANIRSHGGSNHYLVPTGLLQYFAGSNPENHHFAGGLFSSEVIRIEHTNSSFLNKVYPSEETSLIQPPRALELLKQVGHNGRLFSPTRWHPSFFGNVKPYSFHGVENQPGPSFIRYTLPPFELRKVLEEIRQRKEIFSLEYTRLSRYDPADVGTAPGMRVRLWEDGQGGKTCVLVDSNAPCSPEELVFLPPLGFWAYKHFWFWPNLIIPGQPDQHSGYCWDE